MRATIARRCKAECSPSSYARSPTAQMGKQRCREGKHLAQGLTADPASKLQAGSSRNPRPSLCSKPGPGGGRSEPSPETSASNPGKKAASWRELRCPSTWEATQGLGFLLLLPASLVHLEKAAAQRLPSTVSIQARLRQDFKPRGRAGGASVSDHLGTCLFLASSPDIQAHVGSSPPERQ